VPSDSPHTFLTARLAAVARWQQELP
jgi:hypothetical protein